MRRFFQFVREYLRNTNKFMLFLCILASLYGLVLIYSATFSYNTVSYVRTQALAIVLGVLAFWLRVRLTMKMPHGFGLYCLH